MNSYPLRIQELKSMIKKYWLHEKNHEEHVHEWVYTKYDYHTGYAIKGYCKTCNARYEKQ